MTGQQLIDALCKRLKFQNRMLDDSTIIRLLRSLTSHELTMTINFGEPDEWHNERINQTNESPTVPKDYKGTEVTGGNLT